MKYRPDPKRLAKAEAGDAEAQFDLAGDYRFDDFDGKDGAEEKEREAAAFPWYVKAAGQGYTDAEEALGSCYRFGRGTAPDAEKARVWLKKAADKGNAEARLGLGDLADEEEDYAEAVKWYSLAADSDDTRVAEDAAENLARYYEEGLGVPRDERRAEEYRKRAGAAAAEQKARDAERDAYYKMSHEERYVYNRQEDAAKNVAGAEGHLAVYYYVDKKYADALPWAQRGADKGDPRAQNILARFFDKNQDIPHFEALGLKKNAKKAESLYILAAFGLLKNEKETFNANWLGDQYSYGFDVFPKNPHASACWCTLAAAAGNKYAIGHLTRCHLKVDLETAERFILEEKERAERYLAAGEMQGESDPDSGTAASGTGDARKAEKRAERERRKAEKREAKEARKAEKRAEKERRRER
ncbi:hypothetical protein FACS1894211_15110 [Clostridia bacterium]|nr:hypothetical protein FACS1894211_15110 [Clostridia bacterium]